MTEVKIVIDGQTRLAAQILATLDPLAQWAYRCHEASLEIVKSGVVAGRVARGGCTGIGSQHSWVVLGEDCYDDDAVLIDPTLWSYDETVKGIWVGTYRDGRHRPHGKGLIWTWGRPERAVEPPIALTPREPLSALAQTFLDALGPLDRRGWGVLAHAPVEGWPAQEIFEAMLDTKGLGPLIPIDIVGMVTDRNPSGLYLKEASPV